MNRRMLGRTGIAVSEVGFGGWAIGGNRYGNSYGTTDDAESLRAVRRAFELGCTFFDTADVYGHGHSEELLGEALAGVRDRVVIATKVGGNFYNRGVHALLRDKVADMAGVPYEAIPADAPLPAVHDTSFTGEYVRFALERSLRRLRTDYVDLLQLHNPPLNVISAMETWEALEVLKSEGKIRAYGLSIHEMAEGLAAVDSTMPDAVQVVYNLARREPEERLFPAARAAGVGVIAREPLANGLLTGAHAPDHVWEKGDIRGRMPRPYVQGLTALGARVRELAAKSNTTPARLALKFALDNPAVSVVIVGVKTAAQADDNFGWET